MHRDLKPANILIHNGLLKIGDLGISKELPEELPIDNTTIGTRSTMAPEVAEGKPYGFKVILR